MSFVRAADLDQQLAQNWVLKLLGAEFRSDFATHFRIAQGYSQKAQPGLRFHVGTRDTLRNLDLFGEATRVDGGFTTGLAQYLLSQTEQAGGFAHHQIELKLITD